MTGNGTVHYDCIVIGGGPAGLSAGIMLARYGRQFLIFDDNHPRNAKAHSLHGFLGHDGIAPADLLQKGRGELSRYGGTIVNGTVQNLIRAGDRFLVTTSKTYSTRTILLATGVRDILPTIQGIDEFYGASIFHCPDCDGHEVRNRHVAVVADAGRALSLLKALRVWTNRLTLLLNGEHQPNSYRDRQTMDALDFKIVRNPIAALEGNVITRQVEKVRFIDGEALPCDALFFDLGVRPVSPFLKDLGCAIDADTQFIKVGSDQQTSVPGVYAAGDISPDSHMAVVAAAEGTMAAIQIHKALLRETT